ncbi:hypothetical protein EZS27_034098 [termite gut metagenome]|uniref:Helix-turn-helix domain-containing protein n=1 Tax=termite gut metagenome TaxID=433724 RepID=A0A5J4Q1T1_9ZZZZ
MSINVNKEDFEEWMNRIMERFDKLEGKMGGKEKIRRQINGELLFDNQDLCLMLSVSKRTLQRYRTAGVLPYKQIDHDQKIYYLESDVRKFVKEYLQIPQNIVSNLRDEVL